MISFFLYLTNTPYVPNQVTLYVDGVKHATHEAASPDTHLNSDDEVIDDWPLHRSRNVHFTRFVVGACWQGW